jgi:hypothetical protein
MQPPVWTRSPIRAGCSAGRLPFFYLAPRLDGLNGPIPLSVCIAFPAVTFGVVQIGRYWAHRTDR